MFFLFYGIVSCVQISHTTSVSFGAVDEDYTIHDCLFTGLSSSIIEYSASGGHTLTMILVYTRHITTDNGALCCITRNIELEHHFVALGQCTATNLGSAIYYCPNSYTESNFEYYSTRGCHGQLFRFHSNDQSSSLAAFHFKNSNYSYSDQSPSAFYMYSCNIKTNFKYCHITSITSQIAQFATEQSNLCPLGSESYCQINDYGSMEFCYFANNKLTGNWKGVIYLYGPQITVAM